MRVTFGLIAWGLAGILCLACARGQEAYDVEASDVPTAPPFVIRDPARGALYGPYRFEDGAELPINGRAYRLLMTDTNAFHLRLNSTGRTAGPFSFAHRGEIRLRDERYVLLVDGIEKDLERAAAQRRAFLEFEERQQALGLVKYGGRWVPADEAARLALLKPCPECRGRRVAYYRHTLDVPGFGLFPTPTPIWVEFPDRESVTVPCEVCRGAGTVAHDQPPPRRIRYEPDFIRRPSGRFKSKRDALSEKEKRLKESERRDYQLEIVYNRAQREWELIEVTVRLRPVE